MSTGFPCTQCGLCCQNLHRNPLYQDLDRGDGTCRHYDEQTRLCRVYEERPLLCRIDATYEALFAAQMERDAFYKLNLAACQKLQAEAEQREVAKGEF